MTSTHLAVLLVVASLLALVAAFFTAPRDSFPVSGVTLPVDPDELGRLTTP